MASSEAWTLQAVVIIVGPDLMVVVAHTYTLKDEVLSNHCINIFSFTLEHGRFRRH